MSPSSLPINQVLHGDCIDLLPTIPEKSIDLIFADPPYNLQLQRDLWRPNLTKVDAVTDAWDHFDGFDDYDQFTHAWLSACRRVLKDTGTLWVIGSYHNIYRVGRVLQDLGFWILNEIVWVKRNPMPNFRGVRFTNAHETLIWSQKIKGAKYTFNYKAMKSLNGDLQMRSDWELPLCGGKERVKIDGEKAHSTQKPEALLYRVILSSSEPDQVILDPFFGTGTTGAVAKKLHRNWIGIEKEQRYIKIARQRIQSVQPEPFLREAFEFPEKRHQPRIPFHLLLESGYVQPGQHLYFGTNRDAPKATVLANGKLQYANFTGSIHQVAKYLRKAPCNGWTHWYYKINRTGKREKIDKLREKFREEMLA